MHYVHATNFGVIADSDHKLLGDRTGHELLHQWAKGY